MYFMADSNRGKIMRIAVAAVLIMAMVFLANFLIFKIANRRVKPDKEINIVATNYVAYDLVRAIVGETTGDQINIGMLLRPGSEAHSFEPSPQDIAAINKADLLVYVGGESEEWVDKLLDSNEINKEKTVRMMDLVELKEEDEIEEDVEEHANEHEHAVEYDEHIWTSPKNTKILLDKIKQKMVYLFPQFKESFEVNAGLYGDELKDIDTELTRIVKDAKRRELIFADRFPFKYLVDDYGLEYVAAFPGCSEQTEASSATIAKLIDKVKNDNLGVILKIELTSDKLAQVIAESTGAKILTLNAAHNISQEDFDNGVRLVDLMRDNLVVLAEALN